MPGAHSGAGLQDAADLLHSLLSVELPAAAGSQIRLHSNMSNHRFRAHAKLIEVYTTIVRGIRAVMLPSSARLQSCTHPPDKPGVACRSPTVLVKAGSQAHGEQGPPLRTMTVKRLSGGELAERGGGIVETARCESTTGVQNVTARY